LVDPRSSSKIIPTDDKTGRTMDMFGNAGAGAGAAAPSSETGTMMDLGDLIDKTKCYARNEDSKFPMTNLFIGDSRLGCKSDADEQLILHIAFQEVVRVRDCCCCLICCCCLLLFSDMVCDNELPACAGGEATKNVHPKQQTQTMEYTHTYTRSNRWN
jgi:hypothetical protein